MTAFLAAFPPCLSERVLMTFPRVVNDKLIAHPSFNLSPVAPV